MNAVLKVVAFRAVYNDTNMISELTVWDRSLRYMNLNRGLIVECLEVHIMKIPNSGPEIEMKILHHKITYIPLHNFSVGLSQECGTCHDINSCFKHRDKCIMSTYWKFHNTQQHCKGKTIRYIFTMLQQKDIFCGTINIFFCVVLRQFRLHI